LAKLEWGAVDLGRGYIKVPAPLGKNRRPLVKPITRHLRAILDRRLEERHLFPNTELIWPGRQMNQPDLVAAGPISNPRLVLALVKERIGLEVTSHDLRRGWASAALCAGVPQEAIKRLMNHLTNNEDVTSGYQILDLNTLRALSQQVEDFLLRSGAAPGQDPNATDTMLDALLSELDEAEKRRLLFDLSAKRLERIA
jgi:integrase